MDQEPGRHTRDPIVITGFGLEVPEALLRPAASGATDDYSHDCRPGEFLKQKKTLKFMSKQDRLAVNAAGHALKSAGLTDPERLGATGVFLTVGYIPFDFAVAAELCADSTEAGRFSMAKFTTSALEKINPLLAFACLPNMPAHHIAMNFGINGEYMITYPDLPQFYLTLNEAVARLRDGCVSRALVGAVADQNNFLVANHYRKTAPALTGKLVDAAGFMVLEKESSARSRNATILARLADLSIHPRQTSPPSHAIDIAEIATGPARLIIELAAFLIRDEPAFRHDLKAWGSETFSRWEKP